MDMLCNKCSEPWDWFYIRDEVLEDEALYQKMKRTGGYVGETDDFDFVEVEAKPVFRLPNANWQFNPGPTIAQCPACIGKEVEPDDNAKIRAELAHLYGDDIDGFMADMEDFGLTEKTTLSHKEGVKMIISLKGTMNISQHPDGLYITKTTQVQNGDIKNISDVIGQQVALQIKDSQLEFGMSPKEALLLYESLGKALFSYLHDFHAELTADL